MPSRDVDFRTNFFRKYLAIWNLMLTFAHKSYVKLLNFNAYEESNSKN